MGVPFGRMLAREAVMENRKPARSYYAALLRARGFMEITNWVHVTRIQAAFDGLRGGGLLYARPVRCRITIAFHQESGRCWAIARIIHLRYDGCTEVTKAFMDRVGPEAFRSVEVKRLNARAPK